MRDVEHARSWLFVPGTRPDRFDKAVSTGADVVVLDLEDAVAQDDKDAARDHVVQWMARGHRAAVRVNAVGDAHHEADVEALAGHAGLAALVVPMADSPVALAALHERLGPQVALVPQVETAVGLARAVELAGSPGVVRLVLGHLDLALDLDASPTSDTVALAATWLVVASRIAGRTGPVASVTTTLDDPAATRHDARLARARGFTGKLCIHPSQVDPVHAEMSPSGDEVAWAASVLAAAAGGAATRLDGHMIDAPVVARAQRLLDRAGIRTDRDRGRADMTEVSRR